MRVTPADERGDEARRFRGNETELGARATALQTKDHVVVQDGRSRGPLRRAQHPAHAIAVHRKRQRLFWNHETETTGTIRRGRGDQLNVIAVTSATRLEQRVE